MFDINILQLLCLGHMQCCGHAVGGYYYDPIGFTG